MSETVDERIARVAFNESGLVAAIIQQWDTARGAHARVDGCRGPAPHPHQRPRHLLVPLPPGVLAQGRHVGATSSSCAARAWTATATRSSSQVDQIGVACHTGTRTCFDADDLAPVEGARRAAAALRSPRRRARAGRRGRDGRRRGGLGVISSTQTWLDVTLVEAPEHALAVAGAAAVPVLAPLSLAVLALGAALSIVGLVLRWVFGATDRRDRRHAGHADRADRVHAPRRGRGAHRHGGHRHRGCGRRLRPRRRHHLDRVAVRHPRRWVILLAAGVFTLVTARSWRGSGRRYHTDADATPAKASSRPRDAIDSWDDLSRGDDPTS